MENLINWEDKLSWPNSVKIISEMGYPKSAPLLMELLRFYQDVNWPVFPTVTEILRTFDREYLIEGFEKTAELAIRYEDYGWIFGLNTLKDDLSIRMEEFKNPELYGFILDNADKW